MCSRLNFEPAYGGGQTVVCLACGCISREPEFRFDNNPADSEEFVGHTFGFYLYGDGIRHDGTYQRMDGNPWIHTCPKCGEAGLEATLGIRPIFYFENRKKCNGWEIYIPGQSLSPQSLAKSKRKTWKNLSNLMEEKGLINPDIPWKDNIRNAVKKDADCAKWYNKCKKRVKGFRGMCEKFIWNRVESAPLTRFFAESFDGDFGKIFLKPEVKTLAKKKIGLVVIQDYSAYPVSKETDEWTYKGDARKFFEEHKDIWEKYHDKAGKPDPDADGVVEVGYEEGIKDPELSPENYDEESEEHFMSLFEVAPWLSDATWTDDPEG